MEHWINKHWGKKKEKKKGEIRHAFSISFANQLSHVNFFLQYARTNLEKNLLNFSKYCYTNYTSKFRKKKIPELKFLIKLACLINKMRMLNG